MHKLLRFAYELQAHLPETNKVVLAPRGTISGRLALFKDNRYKPDQEPSGDRSLARSLVEGPIEVILLCICTVLATNREKSSIV
jgi:hypothetical protein